MKIEGMAKHKGNLSHCVIALIFNGSYQSQGDTSKNILPQRTVAHMQAVFCLQDNRKDMILHRV